MRVRMRGAVVVLALFCPRVGVRVRVCVRVRMPGAVVVLAIFCPRVCVPEGTGRCGTSMAMRVSVAMLAIIFM